MRTMHDVRGAGCSANPDPAPSLEWCTHQEIKVSGCQNDPLNMCTLYSRLHFVAWDLEKMGMGAKHSATLGGLGQKTELTVC